MCAAMLLLQSYSCYKLSALHSLGVRSMSMFQCHINALCVTDLFFIMLLSPRDVYLQMLILTPVSLH